MGDRIRVLNVMLGLAIGEPLGGAERSVVELVRHLDQKRYEPIVCAFWRHGGSAERHWMAYLRQHGVEVFFAADWTGRYSLSRYREGLRNIEAHLHGRSVDIIHTHFQMGSVAALLLKRRLRAKAVMRSAQAGKEWGDGALAFFCRQFFTQWVFPISFDAEVGVSDALVRNLDRRLGARVVRKRALTVHNGVPLDRFACAAAGEGQRSEFALAADDLVVGSVGRLREEKGHSVLLDSAAIVRAQYPNAKFLIVGDGELRTALREKSERLGLADGVVFAGPRQDVERLYRLMDLFVLPSFWEGLPIAVLESMASGVPVVASELPGTRELIQADRTGWLVPAGDPVALANGILRALSDPDHRRAVARAALEQVVPHYAMSQTARQYAQVYECLLAPGAAVSENSLTGCAEP